MQEQYLGCENQCGYVSGMSIVTTLPWFAIKTQAIIAIQFSESNCAPCMQLCMVLYGIAWYCMVLHGVVWYWMVCIVPGVVWYWMVCMVRLLYGIVVWCVGMFVLSCIALYAWMMHACYATLFHVCVYVYVHSILCYVLLWCGTVWHSILCMVWYGVMWYGMVWLQEV